MCLPNSNTPESRANVSQASVARTYIHIVPCLEHEWKNIYCLSISIRQHSFVLYSVPCDVCCSLCKKGVKACIKTKRERERERENSKGFWIIKRFKKKKILMIRYRCYHGKIILSNMYCIESIGSLDIRFVTYWCCMENINIYSDSSKK